MYVDNVKAVTQSFGDSSNLSLRSHSQQLEIYLIQELKSHDTLWKLGNATFN